MEIRGKGLMLGMELNIPGQPIFQECFAQGVIINCTQGNILRFMPALNVTKKQADQAVDTLKKALIKITAS